MKTKIEIRNLNVWFNKRQVIYDVNLKVPEQAITAVIGPSGCGKSTLLRAINRLHDLIPEAKVKGEVLLDGKDIYKEDPLVVRRKIGMVFQKPVPFPSMSIFENVAIGVKLNDLAKKERLEKIVERSLRMAALWEEVKDILESPATSLSVGQQQRLTIARTLALEPEVLLMDEPTSALDPVSMKKIEELIVNLKNDYTIVVVTHDMRQAARISDFTAFMYEGKIIEFNETSELFRNPKEEITEKYITGRIS
ncbi:MAG: phosphate ABC transporter ATP-binding protein [Thaumarchaeota archaeon]|jgi:phosphate transport system ATP-binding protein|nr:phosphate ABC transporter ATP-binding protein [Nitrososphaerota archaeon]